MVCNYDGKINKLEPLHILKFSTTLTFHKKRKLPEDMFILGKTLNDIFPILEINLVTLIEL